MNLPLLVDLSLIRVITRSGYFGNLLYMTLTYNRRVKLRPSLSQVQVQLLTKYND